MQRNPVVSSNIKSIGYENGEMHIEFANGRVYQYSGPKVEEHYNALIKAESVGRHFAQHVRACPHTVAKLVAPVEPGAAAP